MTDLPLAEEVSDSIMVVVDHGLSKGMVLIPCTKQGLTAQRTAELFIEYIFSHFGLPDKIMTDRGVQFDTEFFQELCQLMDIKPSMTTAFLSPTGKQWN